MTLNWIIVWLLRLLISSLIWILHEFHQNVNEFIRWSFNIGVCVLQWLKIQEHRFFVFSILICNAEKLLILPARHDGEKKKSFRIHNSSFCDSSFVIQFMIKKTLKQLVRMTCKRLLFETLQLKRDLGRKVPFFLDRLKLSIDSRLWMPKFRSICIQKFQCVAAKYRKKIDTKKKIESSACLKRKMNTRSEFKN